MNFTKEETSKYVRLCPATRAGSSSWKICGVLLGCCEQLNNWTNERNENVNGFTRKLKVAMAQGEYFPGGRGQVRQNRQSHLLGNTNSLIWEHTCSHDCNPVRAFGAKCFHRVRIAVVVGPVRRPTALLLIYLTTWDTNIHTYLVFRQYIPFCTQNYGTHFFITLVQRIDGKTNACLTQPL